MSDTIVIDGEVELLNVIDGDPDVFIGGGGSQPTGTKSILLTEAGTKTEDVSSYASAEINAVKDATASGVIASFSDGAEDVPMDSCVVNIEPVQSGSGDPSPSNVRPISGWSEVNVYVSPTQSEQDATVYTVSLGQTVYGGTLDVVTGVLTVDRGYVEYDGSSDETWSRYGTGSASAYAMVISHSNVLYNANTPTVQANFLKSTTSSSTWGNLDQFISAQSGNRFVTGIRTITTVADWTAYLAQNPLQVVYKLATQQTIQLTPTEVTTLLGSNSVWADSGSISVGYKADIFLYADSLETIIDTLTGGA